MTNLPPPLGRPLTRSHAYDLAWGACLLAGGGGGSLLLADRLVEEVFTDDVSARLVDLADPAISDTWLAVGAEIGSPARLFDATQVRSRSTAAALDVLEATVRAHGGDRLAGVAAIEVGAVNSLVAVVAALDRSGWVVDADGAGRAVPTLPLTTWAGRLPVDPAVLAADPQSVGRSFSSEQHAADETELETAALGLVGSGVLGDQVGLALYAAPVRRARESAPVTGSMGHAIELGGLLRRLSGLDRVAAVLDYLRTRMGRAAAVVHTGTVVEMVQTTAGLDTGHVLIRGTGEHTGTDLWVTLQNESLFAYRTDRTEPLVIGPDAICYLPPTGAPLDNSDLFRAVQRHPSGQIELTVLAIEAPDRVRNDPVEMSSWQVARRQLGYPGSFAQPWRVGSVIGP